MPRKDRDNPEYQAKNRAYQNAWYHKNKESAIATRKKTKQALRQRVRDYKSSRGCQVCGETHPACLDLHHSDPSTKEMNPQALVEKGWSFDRLVAEFDQLEVLCANCHRKHHWADREDKVS